MSLAMAAGGMIMVMPLSLVADHAQQSTHNSAASDVKQKVFKDSQGIISSKWNACCNQQHEDPCANISKQAYGKEEKEGKEEENEKDEDEDCHDDNADEAAGAGDKQGQVTIDSKSLDLLHEQFDFMEREIQPLPSFENLACLLHTCTKEKDRNRALQLHAHLCSQGLESHRLLGNSLVLMLVKVGKTHGARQVFDKLAYRDDCSWNTLINAFIEHGDLQHALTLYQATRHDESIRLRGYIFMSLLKACAQLKDLKQGLDIHADLAGKEEHKADIFIGSTLVHMYAKFGLMEKAQDSFDQLLVCDTVTWNALIAGYAEHGPGEEALNCYKKMHTKGFSPDSVTFVCSLKACSSIADIEKGQELHADIVVAGFEEDGFAGNTLVDMYAKCGLLVEARNVFDKLRVRNTVSWNVLIAGYADHHRGEEALVCFDKMLQQGVPANAVTFVCSLKACRSIGAIDKGQEIHEIASKKGLDVDLFVGNTLINMYAKFGMLAKAKYVFDRLPVQDSVSWNSLISGYVEHGYSDEALKCFEQMQEHGAEPDIITLVCSLNACGSLGALDKGQEIHTEISRKGLDGELIIGNALVDMYAKFGLLQKAQEVFDKLPLRDAISWSALITGYAEHGYGEQALHCLEQKQLEGICPDVVTFACSLKACSSIGAQEKSQEVHAMIAKQGLEEDLFVANTLIDTYAKFGLLTHAQTVFDMLSVRDAVSWNALLAGYAEHGYGMEALNCFKQMQLENTSPDDVSFVCALKACGSLGAIDKGQELHAMIERQGLETNLAIGSTLVDMYVKGGLLTKAQEVFDKISDRDKVLWNALMAGYVEAGNGEEALTCFERMLQEGISPDVVTLTCISKACAIIGAFEKSQKVLCMSEGEGLERNPMVGTSLIDMYARCGLLANAHEVFEKLSIQETASWNALMAGCAQWGEHEVVFLLFERMNKEREPDQVTFLNILNVCSHSGLVGKGQEYFEVMSRTHKILPNLEHYTCMVDLFGRVGQLDKAEAMVKIMPYHPDVSLWHSMFSACRIWGNTELGREAFEHAVRSGEIDGASFICLQNMY